MNVLDMGASANVFNQLFIFSSADWSRTTPLRRLPSRIASTIRSAGWVSRSRRVTTPSASASSPADRYLPPAATPSAAAPLRDRLDDVGRQQREPHHAVDEAAHDSFSITADRYFPLLQHSLPPMRPRQRADQRFIRPWLRRGPRVAAVGSDDHFPAAAAFPDHRDGDDDGFAVKLPVVGKGLPFGLHAA